VVSQLGWNRLDGEIFLRSRLRHVVPLNAEIGSKPGAQRFDQILNFLIGHHF
jgi:hypothetical protein